jgi:hypothetical protein
MRLPQFTIRDLMWLMALAGVACGWAAEHYRCNVISQNLMSANDELAKERIRPRKIYVGGQNWEAHRGQKMMIEFTEQGGIAVQPLTKTFPPSKAMP